LETKKKFLKKKKQTIFVQFVLDFWFRFSLGNRNEDTVKEGVVSFLVCGEINTVEVPDYTTNKGGKYREILPSYTRQCFTDKNCGTECRLYYQ
jgi:hypothetical protein